ncbi:hypothetical protein D3C87_369710 [compost metagenome]
MTMNRFLKFLALGLLVGSSNLSKAQIVAWQFALPTPTKGIEKSIKATTNDENLETSLLTRGPSAVGKQGNSRGFSSNFPVDANFEEAKKSGSYYQFEVKAKAGYEVSLSSLNASLRRQEQSAHIYKWTYSLDGKNFKDVHEKDITITNINNNGVKQAPISLAAIKELQNVPATKTITFRIYAWGGLTPEGKAIAFGLGKSDAKGSNALAIDGTVTKK